MDLSDILRELPGDPEHDEHQKRLIQDLKTLRDRLEKSRSQVSDREILEAIRKKFELVLSSSFLEDASWLIESLSFTSLTISNSDIPSAWRHFQASQSDIRPFRLDEHPILEGMAFWYFQHRTELFDEPHMVAHSLAIYEYLVQQVRGREATEEYADLFSSAGMHIFYLYYGLREKERAKFYGQLLEMEFQAGRLDREDYDSVNDFMNIIGEVDRQEAEDHATLSRLQWDTITDRETKVRDYGDRFHELERNYEEALAKVGTRADIAHATKLVSKRFGALWNKLHSEARRNITLAEAFSQPPLSKEYPDIPSNALYKALNAELLARIFRPFGKLNLDMLRRLGAQSPVALLIAYMRNAPWPKHDRTLFSDALNSVGKESLICTKANLDLLTSLRHHRNKTEHAEHHDSYTQQDLDGFYPVSADTGVKSFCLSC